MPLPLLAAGALGLGALGSLFKGKSEADKRREESQLYNKYLGDRSTAVNDLLGRISAGGWNPYGPNTLGSTSYGTTTGTSTTDQLQKQRAVTAPEQLAMEQATRALIEGRLGAPSAVSTGEKLRSVAGIQQAQQGARTAAGNVAAARGFGGAQTYAGAAPTETAAASQIADYLASIPSLERARRAEDIGMSEAFQAARRGQDIRTRGTTTSTGTTAGGGTQQVGPDLGMLANLLLPPSPQAGTQTGVSPFGGLSSDLGSALMALYGIQSGRPGSVSPVPSWNVRGGYAPIPGMPGFPIITGNEPLE